MLALAATALSPACYLSHPRQLRGPDRDAAVIDRDPGGSLPDARPVDAGVDAGPPPDFGVDAGIEPEEQPPPVSGTCRIEPTIFPFDDPVLEFRWPSATTPTFTHPSYVQVCATVAVADLDPTDNDDTPQLIFTSYADLSDENGILRIVNIRTGQTTSYPPTSSQRGVLEASTNLAVGDIDNDGVNEIVGIGVGSGTYAFEADGSLLWEAFYPTATERGLFRNRTIGGAVTLADLEGDGTVEVVVGRTVLEGATGALRFTGGALGGSKGNNTFLGPIACVADLDSDGQQEVIAGRTAYRPDGSLYWNNTELADGLCAVAELIGSDPGPEVVMVGRGTLFILDGQSGVELYRRRIEGRGTLPVGGPPTVSDFDGDGRAEIAVAHGANYGVYDLDCEAPGRPSGCLAEGLRWTYDTDDTSSAGTGSSIFDFNGDDRAEVIYNDHGFFRIFDGTTGDVLFQQPNSSRTRSENPVVVDADNDGDAEIVFSANAEARYIEELWTDPGVEVWGDARGRWVGARRIWNQHAYHVTNVEEDGSIPASPTPSWEGLNSYRQNLREGGDVLATPDLWGGRGTYECLSGGRVRLSVEVQNWGLERVGPGVVVSFWRGPPGPAGTRLGERTTTGGLEGLGEGEVVTFVADVGPPGVSFYALLDDPVEPEGGAIAECREDNNEVLIWRPDCGG
ncbi:MAG: hypothetical protein ACFCGT_08435 [Sandaracinaceae bacterium]